MDEKGQVQIDGIKYTVFEVQVTSNFSPIFIIFNFHPEPMYIPSYFYLRSILSSAEFAFSFLSIYLFCISLSFSPSKLLSTFLHSVACFSSFYSPISPLCYCLLIPLLPFYLTHFRMLRLSRVSKPGVGAPAPILSS